MEALGPVTLLSQNQSTLTDCHSSLGHNGFHAFLQSCNKYSLSSYYVPDLIACTVETAGYKTGAHILFGKDRNPLVNYTECWKVIPVREKNRAQE